MLTMNDIMETISMIQNENLDIRTITMGISLLDCADADIDKSCEKVYDKICKKAENLVSTGEAIEKKYGIPIVNKRISVTPISIVASACGASDYTPFAKTLDKAAKACGVNFIGGFSALVQKGYTNSDIVLINSIPEALASTDFVCSSINLASTRTGINMDAVRDMGVIIKKTAEATKDKDALVQMYYDIPSQVYGTLCEKDKRIDLKGSILDPFHGSGTLGVCCEKLNKQGHLIVWTGIELEKRWCEVARKRLTDI